MPKDIEDFFDSAEDGANKAKSAFEGVVDSAGDVDDILNKLGNTEERAKKISNEYASALSKVASESKSAVKAISQVSSAGEMTSFSFDSLAVSSESVASGLAVVATEADKASNAEDKLEDKASGLSGEIKKQAGLLGLLADKFDEGKSEAESFGNGLGSSEVKTIALGAGIVFLASKLGDLIDKFQDTAVSFAKYRVGQEAIARQTLVPGGAEELERLRRELNLTTAQFETFSNILKTGLGSGVANIEKLTKASKQLTETFGGEQLERLSSYVDLLKEIPTLDTDLSITASLDDQTAAIFGIAEAGKIEAVLDLRTAGLAGGIQVELDNDNDVKLLNSSQNVEATVENIHQSMLSIFPPMGPQLGAIIGGTFAVAGAIGGVVVGVGGMSLFLGKRQKDTTKAVDKLRTAINGQTGLTGSTLKTIKGLPKNINRFGAKGLGATLQKALRPFIGRTGAKVVGKASSGVANKVAGVGGKITGTALKTGGVGIALGAVGIAADILGDKLIDSGKKVEGGAVKTSGAFASMTATALTFAAVGSVFPVVGTTIGASIGALVGFIANIDDVGIGLENLGKGLTETITVNGKVISKYNDSLTSIGFYTQAVGEGMTELGGNLKDGARSVWKSTKETTQGLMAFVKENANAVGALALLGPVIGGTAIALVNASKNPEFEKAKKEEAKRIRANNFASKKLEIALKSMQRQLNENIKAFGEQQKATENAFNSMKFKLFEFQKGISDIELENISEIGGTMDDFDMAVQRGVNSMEDNFEALSKASRAERIRISKNGKLTGNLRKLALDTLHAKELEAARNFVKGMSDMLKGLSRTPDIIVSEFEREAREAFLGISIDVGAVNLGNNLGGLSDQIDAASSELEKTVESVKKMNAGVPAVAEKLKKENEKSKKLAKLSIDKLGGSDIGKELAKELEPLLNLDKVGDGIVDKVGAKKLKEEMSSKIEGFNTEIEKIDKEFKDLTKKTTVSRTLKGRRGKGKGKVVTSSIATNAEKEKLVALKRQKDEMQKQVKPYEETLSALDSAGKILDTTVTKADVNADGAKKIAEKLRVFLDGIGRISDTIEADEGVASARRRLEILESQADVQNAIGKASENLNKTLQAQTDLYGKTLVGLDAGIADLKTRRGNVKADDKNRDTKLAGIDEEEKELKQKRNSLVAEMLKVVDVVGDSLTRLEDSFDVKIAKQEIETGELGFDFAEFSDDLNGNARKSFELISNAIKKQSVLQRKVINEAIRDAPKVVEARAKALEQAGNQEEANALRANGVALIQATKRTELGRIEVNEKQKIAEAAQKEADLKTKSVDVEQSVIDAQSSFLSEIGAPFGQIFELQKQSLMLEQKKLEIAKDLVENGGLKGLRLEEAKAEVVKQQFEIQKKAMGAQRNAFDQLLGSVFGAIRSSRGARRQVGTDVGLLGVDSTRVKLKSGVFGKGEGKTLEERTNEFQTVIGGGPSRLGAESQLKPGGGGTAGATARGRGRDVSLENAEKGSTPAELRGAGGGLGGGAQSNTVSVKVTGEVMVKFDTQMFRDAVVTIAQADPEVIDGLVKKGFVKK